MFFWSLWLLILHFNPCLRRFSFTLLFHFLMGWYFCPYLFVSDAAFSDEDGDSCCEPLHLHFLGSFPWCSWTCCVILYCSIRGRDVLFSCFHNIFICVLLGCRQSSEIQYLSEKDLWIWPHRFEKSIYPLFEVLIGSHRVTHRKWLYWNLTFE